MPVKNPHHYALVVGINEYPAISSLTKPIKDAKEFLKWLVDPNLGGLDPRHCEKEFQDVPYPNQNTAHIANLDPSERRRLIQPKTNHIKEALLRLEAAGDHLYRNEIEDWKSSRLYVFFAGHGMAEGSRDSDLFLADAGPGWYGNRAPCHYILEYLIRIRPSFREVVIFADCCRSLKSGAGRSSFSLDDGRWPGRGAIGQASCYATLFNDQSWESTKEDGRGFFSQALLEGLNGAAAPAEQPITTDIPYKNPGDNVREWERKQGMASLHIEAGAAIDPKTGEFVKLGLPYGEKPRLILIHLATEAVRTKSPVVDVEESMTAFARSLGLETNGQQLRFLKEQLARLSVATVRMGVVMEGGRAVQVNTQFVSAFDLWFPKQADQRVLWPSTVRLSEEYFQTLGQHAVPLDHRAVAALASSSMALDVYAWLAQRLHRVPTGKPQFVAWASLYEQFGQGFGRIRDFRRRFLQTLHHVVSAYPASRIAADEGGLTLSHSAPPVPPRFVAPKLS